MTHRQRLTLLAAILGSAVAAIDGSIVNVALPAIERDLGGGLTVAAVGLERVPARARLADPDRRLARRHLRRAPHLHPRSRGVRCLLGPLRVRADDRRPHRGAALQGGAAALVTPSSLAIIVAAFAPKERGAAIGSWTAWGGIATIIGPLAGGWIVDQLSWRWIFALNVPVVVGTLVLVLAAVPKTAKVEGRRVDVIGAALCAVALGGFVFALIEQPHYGWTSPVIAVPLAWASPASRCFSPTSAGRRSRC